MNRRMAFETDLGSKIKSMYMYTIDFNKTIRQNSLTILSELTPKFLSQRITNSAFHNLCDDTTSIPPYITNLLGLGLNFTITPSTTSPIRSLDTDRFTRDFYRRVQFNGLPFILDPDDPQALYIPDTTWEPDFPANEQFAIRCSDFILKVTDLFQHKRTPTRTLLPLQEKALSWLKEHPEIMVVKTDKNLGPAIIEREQYFQYAWRDHLSDRNTYRRLSPEAAQRRIDQIAQDIKFFITTFQASLKGHEITYLWRLLNRVTYNNAFSWMYLMPKIHKNPMKTRAIISYSGSICHGMGCWIDKELKKIVGHLPYVATDSRSVVQQLTAQEWHPSSLLFTMDATSMYTNIHLGHALPVLEHFLLNTDVGQHIANKQNIRVNALIFALTTVMQNNVFRFGDTYWVQLTGTAMGTPPAPAWATLYFAIHEITVIQKYPELSTYCRYIDDGHGVWTPLPHTSTAADTDRWHAFQHDINSYGTTHDFFTANADLQPLTWEFSAREKHSIFLDLYITLQGTAIHTSIYEKPQNLYLYIPPSSCHSPGVIKSLIYGSVCRAKNLCTNPEDYAPFILKTIHRMVHRGHSITAILPIFYKAIENIISTDNAPSHTAPRRALENHHPAPLFLHLPYNPHDVPSSDIYRAFETSIAAPPGQPMLRDLQTNPTDPSSNPDFDTLLVTYHNQRNLSSILSPRKLRLGTFSTADFFDTPANLTFRNNPSHPEPRRAT